MRIAMIHSFYSSSQPSGENRVVVDQVQALREAGHEVLLVGKYTDTEQESPLYPIKTALGVATGFGANPTQQLRDFRPDVVHVVNLFPNFGTAWLRRWPGPVVVTLHNYRSFCSNGLLFRDGEICTECPDMGQHRAVMNRCYRDSALATIPVAISRSRDGVFLLERANAVVTTSVGSNEVIRRFFMGDLRTDLIPNFGSGPDTPAPLAGVRRGWLALGRMTKEKGFLELVRSWPDQEHLTLIGDGPESEGIREAALGRSVEVLSSVSREELRSKLRGYLGLVFPSIWLEVAPQVVVEAMRAGLPVVAFERNGVAQLVRATGAGRTYRDSSSLVEALHETRIHCDDMSQRAIEVFEQNWTKEVWLRSIERVYARVSGPSTSDEPQGGPRVLGIGE